MYYCKDNNISYYKPMLELKEKSYSTSESMSFWTVLTSIVSYVLTTFFLAIFLIVGYLYLTKQTNLLLNPIKYALLPSYSSMPNTQSPKYMVKSQTIKLKKEEIARIDTFLKDNKIEEKSKKDIYRKDNSRTIVVQEGDTLYTLAQKAYGNASYYNLIFDANPKILKNKDDLYTGQVLSVPF